MRSRCHPLIGVLGILCCAGAVAGESGKPTAPTVPPGQTRGQKALAGGPMQYFPTRPDQAAVKAATFIGGKGHEFLVGGGIQPDGTIVLVGNVIGGEFGLGVQEQVLGRDAPRPPAAAVQVFGGQQKPDRSQLASWRHPQATGFIVRCTPDLQRIVGVARMPWLSGAITAVHVADDGGLIIAGRAGEGIAAIGGSAAESKIPPEATVKDPDCDRTFIARLSPDAGRTVWLRTARGPSGPPRIEGRRDGSFCLLAQDVRAFGPDGDERSAAVIPGGVREATAVNPLTGVILRGGEHHWPTGRQPYRCPTLSTYRPDGTYQYHLYDWGGPYVVLDGLFLVSDTAVRGISHDRDGNALMILWSDGGNSVAYRQPTDIRRPVDTRGCGLSGAGANATSFAYLVKMEPKDYQVTGFTLWCSRYANKGNGASITAIAQADDGSIAFAGSSAWGLLQTANKLANGEPAGDYIALLTPDLRGVRFSSAVPGAGRAEVGPGDRWAIGAGSIAGKPHVLYLGSAAADGDVYGLVTATPTVNPVQSGFGGGACDGYAVLLDVSGGAAPSAEPPPPPPSIADLSRYAHAKPKTDGRKAGDKPEQEIGDGAVYVFDPATPKWTTCDAEIRERSGAYWPNFCYGKPLSGEIAWRGGQPSGQVAISLANWCQSKGDQGRRVLGPLLAAGSPSPAFGFAIRSLGTMERRTLGEKADRIVDVATGDAELSLGGKTIAVKPTCVIRSGLVHESPIRMIRIDALFTLKGRQLGLRPEDAERDIDIRVSMQGHLESDIAAKAKGKPKRK